MMATLLLPISYLSLFIILQTQTRSHDWRRNMLRAAILLGIYATFSAELLSLPRLLTRTSLIMVWSLPPIAGGVLYMCRLRSTAPIRVGISLPPGWGDRILLAGVCAVVLLTAIVAWLAPPNTWDSLTYHMSRVAHWAQERGVVPFATDIQRQNFMSPGAEILVLHTYVLGQGDRFVNFVQWSAMIICLVGVSHVARYLGANRRGQLLSVVFTASLPMGIAQATSTMTDYVVAMCMITVTSEVMAVALGEDDALSPYALGSAAGLALLTKPTALAYLPPFAIFAAVVILKRKHPRTFLAWSAIALLMVGLINAGYFGRNLAIYGNPTGLGEKISSARNEIMDLRVLTSNLLRNASLHAGTPFLAINRFTYKAMIKIHLLMGLGITDPRTSVHEVFEVTKPSMNDIDAGNLFQALLIIIAIGVVICQWRKTSSMLCGYLLVTIMTFTLLSGLFKFTIFGSRYHMAFFVLAAPAVGAILGERCGSRVHWLLGMGLLIYSYPWLVHQSQRPLLPNRGNPGLINAPRESFYLPESFLIPMQDIAEQIRNSDCNQIGIAISGNAPEYLFWVLLGAPRASFRMEWIIGDQTPSAGFRDTDFEPCALICDRSCPEEWETFHGMPIVLERAGYRLYLEDE